MFKNLIYKIVGFLLGIDIKQLIDNNSSNLIEIESLRRYIKELESETDSLKSNIFDTKKNFRFREDEFNGKCQTLTAQIDSLDNEIELLQENLVLLKSEKSTLQKQIEEDRVKYSKQLENNHNLSLKIDLLTNDLVEDKNTIDNLKKEVVNFKNIELSQQDLIRSLKELISKQQSEISNAKSKGNEIGKLSKEIDDYKSQIGSLKLEINQIRNKIIRDEIVEINHSKSLKNESIHIVDGVAVVHKGLNIGERSEKEFENEMYEFQYQGEFLFDIVSETKSDSTEFPDVFYPKKRTPILKWHEVKSSSTVGISEPLFVDALKRLNDFVPNIVILQNIALSIRNRDYSYLPDIGLYWSEYNLFVDIEIDEPYDFVSRTPLHYQGSSDYLRNLYFISQGWVVIRFSEEQIVKYSSSCVDFVLFVLNKITLDKRLSECNNSNIIENNPRWTFEQAKEFEAQKYREKYLNMDIDSLCLDNSVEKIVYKTFNGIPPAGDILPKNEYFDFESKIKSFQTKYIRVTFINYDLQFLLEDYELDNQNFLDGIKGFDVVEEKNIFIPFEKVKEFESLDSPFKSPLYQKKSIDDGTISKLVNEAIYNLNPIRIEYKDGHANITFRNIALMDYAGFSENYFCDNIWNKYYDSKGSMIEAFCLLREAQRTFYINRIQTVEIYDVKYIGIGHILSFSSALWHPLVHNDFLLCNHILKLTPTENINSNLVALGNYAHYLLLSGNTEDAINIYREHMGKQINSTLSWIQMNLKDFDELSNVNENYKSKFEEAKRILNW